MEMVGRTGQPTKAARHVSVGPCEDGRLNELPSARRSLRLRASVAAGWSLAQNAARELFAFITFVVLARWFLDEADFGIVALANGFVAFAGLLFRNGFITALIQRPEIDDRHRSAAFWSGMLLSVAAAIAVSALAWPLGSVTDEPRLPHVLQALAFSLVPLAAGTVHEAELRRRLEFRSMAARGFVAAVLGSIAAIAAAIAGAGVWSLVVQSWTTSVASSVMLWLLLPWRPALKLPLREARELLPMGLSVTGLAVVNLGGRIVDRLIIGIVLGVSELGFYYVAQRIIQSVQTVLIQGLNGVALPAFSEANGDLVRVRRGYLFAVHICTAATFPVFLGIALVAERLVTALFGPDWETAATVMQVLALGALPASLMFLNQPLLIAIGQPNRALRTAAIGTAMVVPFALAGSAWGLVGVSVAVSLRQLIMTTVWLVVIRRATGLNLAGYASALAGPIGACGVMAGAVILAAGRLPPGAFGLLLIVLVGMVTYPAMLFLVDRPLLDLVRKLIRDGIRKT